MGSPLSDEDDEVAALIADGMDLKIYDTPLHRKIAKEEVDIKLFMSSYLNYLENLLFIAKPYIPGDKVEMKFPDKVFDPQIKLKEGIIHMKNTDIHLKMKFAETVCDDHIKNPPVTRKVIFKSSLPNDSVGVEEWVKLQRKKIAKFLMNRMKNPFLSTQEFYPQFYRCDNVEAEASQTELRKDSSQLHNCHMDNLPLVTKDLDPPYIPGDILEKKFDPQIEEWVKLQRKKTAQFLINYMKNPPLLFTKDRPPYIPGDNVEMKFPENFFDPQIEEKVMQDRKDTAQLHNFRITPAHSELRENDLFPHDRVGLEVLMKQRRKIISQHNELVMNTLFSKDSFNPYSPSGDNAGDSVEVEASLSSSIENQLVNYQKFLCELEKIKLFNNEGFDLPDIIPETTIKVEGVTYYLPPINYNIYPIRKLEPWMKRLNEYGGKAMKQFNEINKSNLEIVEFVKVNYKTVAGYIFYMTVKAKPIESSADYPTTTFQIKVTALLDREVEVDICRPRSGTNWSLSLD